MDLSSEKPLLTLKKEQNNNFFFQIINVYSTVLRVIKSKCRNYNNYF